MTCPSCGNHGSRVVDSRKTNRRRECSSCKVRWSTVEVLASGTIQPKRELRKKDARSWLERINEKLATTT